MALGMLLILLSRMFKIPGWPGTAFWVIGYPMEMIGFLMLVYKALRYPGFRDFFNS